MSDYNFSAIEKKWQKVIDGYKLDKVEGKPLTIGSDATKNVIKVYYEIGRASCRERV